MEGFFRSIAQALTISPGVQKPHWKARCSTKARCTGCSWSPAPMPSMVTTLLPCTSPIGVTHERTASRLTATVHEPQWE